jgi:hypothetical protein
MKGAKPFGVKGKSTVTKKENATKPRYQRYNNLKIKTDARKIFI